ncbi:MAG: hypothetical protein QM820_19435 [Minicystis sp.]
MLRRFFWEYDFDDLSWESDRVLITERLLSRGTWPTWKWVREQLGDEGLAAYLRETRGRALSPRQLRFWGLILGLPKDEVSGWIEDKKGSLWFERTAHEAPPQHPARDAAKGAEADRSGGHGARVLPRRRHRAGAAPRS